jgi:hypothetical protein
VFSAGWLLVIIYHRCLKLQVMKNVILLAVLLLPVFLSAQTGQKPGTCNSNKRFDAPKAWRPNEPQKENRFPTAVVRKEPVREPVVTDRVRRVDDNYFSVCYVMKSDSTDCRYFGTMYAARAFEEDLDANTDCLRYRLERIK